VEEYECGTKKKSNLKDAFILLGKKVKQHDTKETQYVSNIAIKLLDLEVKHFLPYVVIVFTLFSINLVFKIVVFHI
jgi:hypothetical protein